MTEREYLQAVYEKAKTLERRLQKNLGKTGLILPSILDEEGNQMMEIDDFTFPQFLQTIGYVEPEEGLIPDPDFTEEDRQQMVANNPELEGMVTQTGEEIYDPEPVEEQSEEIPLTQEEQLNKEGIVPYSKVLEETMNPKIDYPDVDSMFDRFLENMDI